MAPQSEAAEPHVSVGPATSFATEQLVGKCSTSPTGAARALEQQRAAANATVANTARTRRRGPAIAPITICPARRGPLGSPARAARSCCCPARFGDRRPVDRDPLVVPAAHLHRDRGAFAQARADVEDGLVGTVTGHGDLELVLPDRRRADPVVLAGGHRPAGFLRLDHLGGATLPAPQQSGVAFAHAPDPEVHRVGEAQRRDHPGGDRRRRTHLDQRERGEERDEEEQEREQAGSSGVH